MILVDANILLYARFVEFPQHDAALSWLEHRLAGDSPVGLPWASLLAFLRIASNARFLEIPLPLEQGTRQVRTWLSAPTAWIPRPTEHHAKTLSRLLDGAGATPKRVTDAHLAAMAIDHGLVLCSADTGFRHLTGLRWENPLA